VPIFGISEDGVVGYVRTYFEPTWLMLPFNIISELTRTLALAVRLFGNIMSGTMIVAILLGITPLFFPINVTLAAFVADLLKSRSSETTILAVGERILGRLEDAGFSIGRTYTVPNSVIGIAPLISQILIDQEKEYANGETYIFHNRPTGAHSYEPVKQRLLPLDAAWQSAFEHIQWPTHLLPEVLGSVESTLRAFVHEYLFVSLFKACAESLASENACRLAAMQSAQRNIDELLGRLRVVYNQTRQTAIDEELFDVVSGFEALRTMNDER
jgi:F-type H+-transporting ATPase subunit gamma